MSLFGPLRAILTVKVTYMSNNSNDLASLPPF